MVRAILEGRKTQTRRIVKPDIANFLEDGWEPKERMYETRDGDIVPAHTLCPYGQPGDRLWVRETWQPNTMKTGWPYYYRATDDDVVSPPWKSPLFMPRAASRILLEITDVRVERLREITHEDAMAEGFELTGWRPTYYDPDSGGEARTPQDNFAEMWEKIHGSESWWQNPWVWAITFKRIEP